MRNSAQLSLASPAVSARRRGVLGTAIITAFVAARAAFDGVRRVAAGRRPSRARRQDLPWDVGLDRLAEQAFPPWIYRA